MKIIEKKLIDLFNAYKNDYNRIDENYKKNIIRQLSHGFRINKKETFKIVQELERKKKLRF